MFDQAEYDRLVALGFARTAAAVAAGAETSLSEPVTDPTTGTKHYTMKVVLPS